MKSLFLGGARSGKSARAEALVGNRSCLYVATARPYVSGDEELDAQFDQDFQQRIQAHRDRRPAAWLLDESTPLLELLSQPPRAEVTLIDDLGTWVSGLLDAHGWDGPRGRLDAEFAELARLIAAFPADLLIVSPEVGLAVIPEHHSGRLFRDEIGTLNQLVAEECDTVSLVVAGQELVLKGRA